MLVRFWALFLLLMFIDIAPQIVSANEMVGVGDLTPIYPRPNTRFRPIFMLRVDKSLRVAPKIVNTDNGNFYKVLLYRPNGKHIIGYVSETANVRIKTAKTDDDEFTSYSEQALSSNSLSSSASALRGGNYLLTFGYMHYLSPGFYSKLYVGEWFSQNGGGDHIGIEFGNDSLINRELSMVFALGGGALFPAQDSGVFLGSKANGLNYLLRGLVGVKLNLGGKVAFGFEGVQSVVFNANNSLVCFGGQLSIEVGI